MQIQLADSIFFVRLRCKLGEESPSFTYCGLDMFRTFIIKEGKPYLKDIEPSLLVWQLELCILKFVTVWRQIPLHRF